MSRTLQHIGSGAVQLQDHLFQLAHYGKALRRLDDSLLKAMGPRLEANKKTVHSSLIDTIFCISKLTIRISF
jgi:hypothetical protein